jgi:hypothetical protein
MIWADVNPLSFYGTHDGKTAGPAMANGLGLPKLQEMVHDFVSGLIEKELLAEDAVVVVLGKAPWSCCEKLDSLLTKLDVHQQVDHPVFTGMWTKGQCQEARTLRAMVRLNNGEQCAVFVYVTPSPQKGPKKTYAKGNKTLCSAQKQKKSRRLFSGLFGERA